MPDYNFLMESRLKPAQSRVVSQLGRLAASQGLNLYLAGGAVRDLTLGLEAPQGLEFVVEGNIKKLLRSLTSGVKQKPRPAGAGPAEPIDLKVESLRLDSRVNRAEVIFEGGVRGEIATTRNETYNSPGRPPAISPGTIFDDLRRRDFSVNAMAVSLHPYSRGLLLDPTNGAADLERKELRVLHSRSFLDDPARIYRLMRLAMRLDFKPDEKTARWLDVALEEKVWQQLREDQQGRELRAILAEEVCGKLLKALGERELIAGLDRKLASARIEFDKFERIRNAVRTAGSGDALFLNFLALVAKLSSGERARLAKKVFGDAKTVKHVLGLEHEAAKLARLLGSSKAAKPSQVYMILNAAPPPLPAFLLADHSQTAVQNRVKAFFTKFPEVRARSPRAELESFGMAPGAKFEKILEQVFLDELDGKIRTPPQMTKALQDYSGLKAPPPPPPPAAAKAGSKATTPREAGAKGSKPAAQAPPSQPTRMEARPASPAKSLPAAKAKEKEAVPTEAATKGQKPAAQTPPAKPARTEAKPSPSAKPQPAAKTREKAAAPVKTATATAKPQRPRTKLPSKPAPKSKNKPAKPKPPAKPPKSRKGR